MRSKLLGAALVTVLLLGACGGDSGGGESGAVKGGILKIGTVDYIDSLNPFIAIESQSYNAMVMQYPQLVQYGPGIKIEGGRGPSTSSPGASGRTASP
jgi:peptide/nickel transport system substrate-binding protein